ncbi:MAG TPA: MerR family transcriptional regulator [Chitinophagaceae bacterium]|nr:MerR family transcriptional regulator [Chitinophagaceae bacterium]
MNAFSIKDLENLSGIKAHTIRIWEQRYGFLKPQRTGTNIRYYTNNELKKILNVALLNKYGYKISHINRMSSGEIDEKIIALTQTEAQQEKVVNDLLRYMIDLDMTAFEDALDHQIKEKDIDKVIMQVIFPFLEKIGILWVTNHINPAQEHLVSNIIRQKLIVGIENMQSYIHLNKTALLFLPEGEHHELGLLFAQYIFKGHGLNVLYMGADSPMADIGFIIKQKRPDFIFTHLISLPANFNFDKFIDTLAGISHSIPVIVSGQSQIHHKKQAYTNIHFKYSLGEIMEYIASL